MGFQTTHTDQEVQQRKLYTGPAAFQVLAINPTAEKLSVYFPETLVEKLDTTYALKESNLPDVNAMERPILIVLQGPAEMPPIFTTVRLSEDYVITSTGKSMWIDDQLNNIYGETFAQAMDAHRAVVDRYENLPLFNENNYVQAHGGELDWYKFVATYVRFDFKGAKQEGDNFFDNFLKINQLDYQSMYNGKFDNLSEMIEEGKKRNWGIALMASVRSTDKGDYQDVVFNNQYMYRVTDQGEMITSTPSNMAKKSGKNPEYPITKNHHSFVFQQFQPIGQQIEKTEAEDNTELEW